MFLLQRVPLRLSLLRPTLLASHGPYSTIMPPKKRAAATKPHEAGEEKSYKRTKTAAPAPQLGKKLKDDEGNQYWEIGGNYRRVTVSNFKGKSLVSIREHYEKDGKVLPGKKGISLSIEQFNAVLAILPQLEECFKGEEVLVRPDYGVAGAGAKAEVKEEEEHEEEEEEEEEEEGEGEEEGEEEEEVKAPKKKGVQKKARKQAEE